MLYRDVNKIVQAVRKKREKNYWAITAKMFTLLVRKIVAIAVANHASVACVSAERTELTDHV